LSSNIAGILIYVPQYLYSLLFIEALGVQSRSRKTDLSVLSSVLVLRHIDIQGLWTRPTQED